MAYRLILGVGTEAKPSGIPPKQKRESKQLSSTKGSLGKARRPVPRPQPTGPGPMTGFSHYNVSGETELKRRLGELSSAEPVRDRQSLCQELLLAGFVNSFAEFFQLTHRDDVKSASPSLSELEFVKQRLSEAETAHRSGNSDGMYHAYKHIANHFASKSEIPSAIYFYEKCLELATIMSNPSRESESNHNLGVMFLELNDLPAAIRFHECHLQVARDAGDEEGVQTAGRELANIYRRQAQEYQDSGNIGASINSLSRCLDSALAADDSKMEAFANYQLGMVYNTLKDPQTAIPYLENYLQICRQGNDRVGEAEGEAALGRAQRLMKDNVKAVRHFQTYLDLSIENDRRDAQQRAFAELGSLYCELGLREANSFIRNFGLSKLVLAGEFGKATEHFERNYHLTRAQGTHSGLDTARIRLGMARGDLTESDYFNTMCSDVRQLVEWQCSRKPFIKNDE